MSCFVLQNNADALNRNEYGSGAHKTAEPLCRSQRHVREPYVFRWNPQHWKRQQRIRTMKVIMKRAMFVREVFDDSSEIPMMSPPREDSHKNVLIKHSVRSKVPLYRSSRQQPLFMNMTPQRNTTPMELHAAGIPWRRRTRSVPLLEMS